MVLAKPRVTFPHPGRGQVASPIDPGAQADSPQLIFGGNYSAAAFHASLSLIFPPVRRSAPE